MRRGPGGIGAINKQRLAKAKYEQKGTAIADAQITQMSKQLESFKTYLEEFATKHKSDIKKNPEFRGHFQQMCARIGVDPLASSKGFWAEMLGVGDFYYELGVQAIEICMATRTRNGGLLALDELHRLLLKGGGKSRQDVTEDDLARAIKKLHTLGSGFQIIPVGKSRIVQSVPGELNMDHTTVLQLAQATSYISLSAVKSQLGWEEKRAVHVVDHMIQEGMIWIDDQDPNERLYWFPGLFKDT
ncbi:vacuolar-sorting protein SNF8-like [Dendronephthya gigantea]|uniref:vacuolar-sorting protein SNF8-like n=1 Tax=Dendronephthya gigantea TaxID=151771 RepID=UPI00106C033F|nr:vacuolar-sorting protein SNF8-like [Dendronephthya gigantea]XP_028416267.1 vacuolar-sorting protein SNF8-like [Dendronephthya gigantea]